jgi:hypothetical protein
VELFDVRAAELDAHADLVDRIMAREALGAIVRAAVDGAAVAQALARLAASDPPRTELAPRAHALGCMLAPTAARPTGPSLDEYLAMASWRADELFDPSLRAALDAQLATLAGGREVTVPRSADGRVYARATVHVFEDGGEAPIHCDSYGVLPAREELAARLDGRTQLSWYIPLSLPEQGGDLAIYDLRHGEPGAAQPARSGARARSYRVGVGDLVVFDGGRWFHRVEPCRGPTPRRTFAGFAGLARGGRALYVWG